MEITDLLAGSGSEEVFALPTKTGTGAEGEVIIHRYEYREVQTGTGLQEVRVRDNLERLVTRA